MKKLSFISALLVMAIAMFAVGCDEATTSAAKSDGNIKNSNTVANAAPPAAAPSDDAPRITLADAKADFDAGKAIFVDTRPEPTYKSEHIKGAINIAMDQLDAKIGKAVKGKKKKRELFRTNKTTQVQFWIRI